MHTGPELYFPGPRDPGTNNKQHANSTDSTPDGTERISGQLRNYDFNDYVAYSLQSCFQLKKTYLPNVICDKC